MGNPEKQKTDVKHVESVGDKKTVKSSKSKGKGKKDPSDTHLTKVNSAATGASRDKIELVHLEDVTEEKPKPTKVKKFKRHCARFWLCYFLALIVLLAIGLPVLFLEIVPALAQLLIDNTDLPIRHATIKAVDDDHIVAGLATTLNVPGGLTVKLDAFELWLYNKETPEFAPYTMYPLADQTVRGKTDITVEEQLVGVGNRTELDTWLTGMLYNKKHTISARGNTTARLGALHFPVKLDKTIKVDALNELDGFRLDNSLLKLPPDEDGTNVVGNLTLPNWSLLTIGLGNLTFNVWAGDLLIGETSVDDVLLPPGNTTMPFKGKVDIQLVMDNLGSIISGQSGALGRGVLELGIGGNKTLVDGEHITYLESVLNKAHIMSEVPVAQLLGDTLRSIREGELEMDSLLDLLPGDISLDGLLEGADDGEEEGGDDQGADGGEEDNQAQEETEDSEGDGLISDLLDNFDVRSERARRKFTRLYRRASEYLEDS